MRYISLAPSFSAKLVRFIKVLLSNTEILVEPSQTKKRDSLRMHGYVAIVVVPERPAWLLITNELKLPTFKIDRIGFTVASCSIDSLDDVSDYVSLSSLE